MLSMRLVVAILATSLTAAARYAQQEQPKGTENEKQTIHLTPELVEQLVNEGKLDREKADRILERLKSEGDGGGGMTFTFGGAPAGEDGTVAGPTVGEAAPPLTFDHIVHGSRTWEGETAAPTWEDLQGKVVVIEFWATWCAPCIAALPHLNKVAAEVQNEDVVFLSISNEPVETIEAFLPQHEFKSIVVSDPDGSTNAAYGVVGIPLTVLVDPEGRIAALTHPNMVTAEVIRKVRAGEPLDLAIPSGAPEVTTFSRPSKEDHPKEGT